MDAQSNLDELTKVLSGQVSLEVATIARPPRGSQIPEARAMSLAGDAEQFFRDVIDTKVQTNLTGAGWALKKLDPLYKPDPEELGWDSVQAIPALVDATAKVKNMSALSPFDPGDEQYKKRLAYWAATLTASDGRQAYFFRSFTSTAELKRKSGVALVNRAGSFTRVDEAIFVFDVNIDCFVFGEYAYVLRKTDFRRIFDQMGAILARAKTAAGDLNKKVPIANFSDFEAACSTDSRLADKLLSVRGRDYFDRLNYQMLEPVIKEFKLTIPTKKVNGQTQLVFESPPAGRFRILKLVDDDYLSSSMTSHGYEVNSKLEAT